MKGVIYACSGFFELYFIFFLHPYLQKPLNKKQFLALGGILFGLTLGPLTGSIAEFNPFEAAIQRYPAYEEWRISGFGKYISQTDFFSIYPMVVRKLHSHLFCARRHRRHVEETLGTLEARFPHLPCRPSRPAQLLYLL
ncbi:hypothetical protein [Paenibacillus phocaensis]|uniref:hypothetical protein n=1 Tax=Paenibacillus phocaensis TaxID=1776378 RepID=UPI000839C64A|nr:hypothetical protein [Paenibacillus phocaensis]